MIYFIVGTV